MKKGSWNMEYVRKANKIITFAVIILIFLSNRAYAGDNLKFFSVKDENYYTTLHNNASSQKNKFFTNEINFNNIKTEEIKIEKNNFKNALLYISPQEANAIIVKHPDSYLYYARKGKIYFGLGLTQLGYDVYSQYFDKLAITNEEISGNYLTIKPELLYFNYRYEPYGKFKFGYSIITDLTVMITVSDNNKQVLQKIYKVNNLETPNVNRENISCTFNTAVAKAIEAMYRQNLQDLVKMYK